MPSSSSHRHRDRDRHRHRSRSRSPRSKSRSRSRSKERRDKHHHRHKERSQHESSSSSKRARESPERSNHSANGNTHDTEIETKEITKRPKTTSISLDFKLPQSLPVKNESSQSNAATESTTQQTTEETPKPIQLDISALLQDLASSKQALQQQLEVQKKEHTQSLFLQKSLQQHKIRREASASATPMTPATPRNEEPFSPEQQAIESEKRMAALQARISANLAKLAPTTTDKKDKAEKEKAKVDEKSREIDIGSVLNMKISRQDIVTLKANKKMITAEKKKDKEKKDIKAPPQATPANEMKKSVFFDPNLHGPKMERRKRSLVFKEAGTVMKQAEQLRTGEQKGTPMEVEFTQTQDNQAEKQKEKVEEKPKKVLDPIPVVEWWDKYLLPDEAYTNLGNLPLAEIGHYVEHPVPIKPPGESDAPVVMPMYLTKKEQKTLRKRIRAERNKEKQERIMLGLEKAPQDKARLSNFMMVKGTEAVADPTAIEQEVLRQRAERMANHEARNQARKLTKEQRKEKNLNKLKADTKRGTWCAVFCIDQLKDPRHNFKVDATAREWALTGCVIIFGDKNVVIVEGGQKAIRKFKKVLLNRIDWDLKKDKEAQHAKEDDKEEKKNNDDAMEVESNTTNKCTLVWEGVILKPNFDNFRFESNFQSEAAVRKYLLNHWSEQYWDMCLNFKEAQEVL